MICLTDAIAPIPTNATEATTINVFTQNTIPRFDGLKVTL